MRILMLRPQIELGGVTSHILLLARGLLEHGHQVEVATTGGDALHLLEQMGVPVFMSPLYPSTALNLVRSVMRLVHLVRANRVDILHSHHRFTAIVGRLVSRLTSVPLVATIHEFKDDWHLLASLWMGDMTITPSEALKHHLVSFYAGKGEDIVVVPNAVDLGEVPDAAQCAAVREALIPDPDALTVGCIGRLSPEKGVRYFVQSIPLIIKFAPKVRFLVVGDGPEQQALTRLTYDLGLRPSQILLGPRTDIPEIMQLLDVVVIPSVSESFSLVALEAMRAARPVVATSVGGLPEVVRHGETGRLVPPESPRALAQTICDLLADSAQRRRLGERGRQIVLEEYAASLMVDRTIEVYQRAKATTKPL